MDFLIHKVFFKSINWSRNLLFMKSVVRQAKSYCLILLWYKIFSKFGARCLKGISPGGISREGESEATRASRTSVPTLLMPLRGSSPDAIPWQGI